MNDGKTDYSIHHNIPSLAFGHCDFHYRNKGALSGIRITQAPNSFRVETDGTLCFETGQVCFQVFGDCAPKANFLSRSAFLPGIISVFPL